MAIGFIREFIRRPTQVGAIMPSSRFLARTIIAEIGVPEADVVLEFGAGTGAFTGHIAASVKPGAVFWAFEINPRLVEELRAKHPAVTIKAQSVEDAPRLLAEAGLPPVKCIVCGLPWAAFEADLQRRLLAAAHDVLEPGGCFATFAYLQGLLLPAGQRFQKLLHTQFASVSKSRTVWRNVPPAFVYRCRKG